ncbi:MAG: hypothetical protein AB1896_14405 [Thermodesulfobacteriota bacterium]
MARLFLILMVAMFLFPFVFPPAFGSSSGAAEEVLLYSSTNSYYLAITPVADAVQKVFDAHDPAQPLWRFTFEIYLPNIYVSDNGQLVVTVAWPYVAKGDEGGKGVIIYHSSGRKTYYSFDELSVPREYKGEKGGPIGEFWRVWYEDISATGEYVEILTSDNKRVRISLEDGRLLK